MAFNVISAAGTVFALALSAVALYRQRATPRLEGQLVVMHEKLVPREIRGVVGCLDSKGLGFA